MKNVMRVLLVASLAALVSGCGIFGGAAVPPPPTIVPAAQAPATTVASPPVASMMDETPTVPLADITLTLVPVVDGFTRPLYVTHAGDDRLFVVTQAGQIFIVEDGAVNSRAFLNIVDIVNDSANEQGLLSVAFHPNYASNGFFFINYTNTDGDTTIARYSVSNDPNFADHNSAKILLTIGQPFGNHNGGQLKFGPDGYLYIGMGDGGAANDPRNYAQNLTALLGKILRIDVDNANPYGVPADNPFVDTPDARPEIWSYGWRNPWRFMFDRLTGDMYIADVGQNQYEEVHVELAGEPGGQNYGWRIMEGTHCFNPSTNCDPTGLEMPIAEYSHSQGCSVTGGYVYRGALYPALNGVYLYGDYCSGIIWGVRQTAEGTWEQTELLTSNHLISSFGEDVAGELYLVDHRGGIFQLATP